MKKRIGRFVMSRELVERNPETARAIMGRCIVVRCEMMYHIDTLEYVALSPDFDELPQGMIVPEYEVIIFEDGQRIEFKRSNVKVSGPEPLLAKVRSTAGLCPGDDNGEREAR